MKITSIIDTTKDCLIIGRSPFVNEVKWDKVKWDRYFVICINYPVPDIPVDIVIARDDTPDPVLAPETIFVSPRTGFLFVHDITHPDQIQFVGYTSSSAVYLAYKLGFKRAYLIGIDHREDNKPFVHYDGIINKSVALAQCNNTCKGYICSFKNKMELFQTNPTVKDEWDLPYRDVSVLY